MRVKQSAFVILALVAGAAAGWWMFGARASEDPSEVPDEAAAVATEPDATAARSSLAGRATVATPGVWVGPERGGAMLDGSVVDESDLPIAGARVTLERNTRHEPVPPAGAEVSSDGRGSFRFEGLPRSAFRVLVAHPEFIEVVRYAVPVPGPRLVVRLARGEPCEGLVVDARGAPVAGARVGLAVPHRSPGFETTSDAAGHFRVDRVPGVASLDVYAEAGARGRLARTGVPWRRGQPLRVELEPVEELSVIRVAVLAKDDLGGADRPVEGVEVRHHPHPRSASPFEWAPWDETARSDAQGQVEILALPGRTVRVSIASPPEGWRVEAAPSFVVAPVAIQFRLTRAPPTPTVQVTGRVLTAAGRGLAGAEVGVARGVLEHAPGLSATPDRNESPATTTEDGTFALTIRFWGRDQALFVFARAPGFAPSISAPLEWAVPPPRVELRLLPGAALTGRVVDEGRRPVEGARVAVSPRAEPGTAAETGPLDTPAEAVTNATGEFRIDGLTVGGHHVRWRRGGPTTGRTQLVDVVPGETRMPDLVVPRAHSLEGRVDDEDGRAVANASIGIAGPGGWHGNVGTDDGGRFTFHGLEPGSSHVQVAAPGFAAWGHRRVQIPYDGVYVVVLARGRAIEGAIKDADGRPVPDAIVSIGSPEGHEPSGDAARADARGRFTVLGAPDSRLRITARAAGLLFPTRWVERGVAELELVAHRPWSVTGRVDDAQGRPVAAAWVRARTAMVDRRETKTDLNGRFRFDGLYGTECELEWQGGSARTSGVTPGSDVVLRMDAH